MTTIATARQHNDSLPLERPLKRIKTAIAQDGQLQRPSLEHTDLDIDTVPPHPLRVKPQGNAYTVASSSSPRRSRGFFEILPDELLTHFLDVLGVQDLLGLGGTCKALYAFCKADELWRALFVQASPKQFTWKGTWRSTLLDLPANLETNIDCTGVFSDVLYRPFQCAHISLQKYSRNIPTRNQIARLDNLDAAEFAKSWANRPFILKEPVKLWPVYGKWTTQALLDLFPNVLCHAEAVDWPLSTYVDYMRNNSDESPLYLFDRAFVEKMQLQTGKDDPDAAFWIPECFEPDLFAVLGAQRPDSRWMIMGPARSGSTFHKDPNATSAWNTVITGSKYWLMFPSGKDVAPPPGVILSDDSSEITSPLSIAEYLLVFHEIARNTPGCQEGICHAGEVLHVPSGWFHLVLNLDEGIAITQNFVPEAKLVDVMRFLRDTPDQISGFRDDVADPYALFVERLREARPELLEAALCKLEQRTRPGRSKWETLTQPAVDVNGVGGSATGFLFGFDDDYASD